MMYYKLLIFQLIGHLLSDYFFQSDKNAKEKNENGFKSTFILKHVLITFLCSLILSFDINFVFCSLGITITHYLIDGLKNTLNTSKYSFFIDQILHIIFIILFVFLFEKYFISHKIIDINIEIKWVFIIFSYLLCLKPANIMIKEIMKISNIKLPTNNNTELENAGKLIGSLERILVLTLVLLNQFEAIGFLIAAKSILRYKENDTTKTEYVLIGTMASFAIAIVLGIMYTKFF